MAGFYLDRTGPGPGSLSQVYGVFGTVDDTARTLADLASGAGLKRIPVDALLAWESGVPTLRREALDVPDRPSRGHHRGRLPKCLQTPGLCTGGQPRWMAPGRDTPSPSMR